MAGGSLPAARLLNSKVLPLLNEGLEVAPAGGSLHPPPSLISAGPSGAFFPGYGGSMGAGAGGVAGNLASAGPSNAASLLQFSLQSAGPSNATTLIQQQQQSAGGFGYEAGRGSPGPYPPSVGSIGPSASAAMAAAAAARLQRYLCPVYLHSHSYEGMGGGAGGRASSSMTDMDDCLFEILLPPGR